MNRRNILKAGLTTAAGLALFMPKFSFAQETVVEEILLQNDIGTNHGHELILTVVDVLKLLRQTREAAPVALDIKGKSGHPHALELTHEDLLTLFVDGQIAKDSTKVAGHIHQVTVRLVVEAKQPEPVEVIS